MHYAVRECAIRAVLICAVIVKVNIRRGESRDTGTVGTDRIKVLAGHLDCSIFNVCDCFEDRVDLLRDNRISEAFDSCLAVQPIG